MANGIERFRPYCGKRMQVFAPQKAAPALDRRTDALRVTKVFFCGAKAYK